MMFLADAIQKAKIVSEERYHNTVLCKMEDSSRKIKDNSRTFVTSSLAMKYYSKFLQHYFVKHYIIKSIPQNSSVLDVGCGYGELCVGLHHTVKGAKYMGIGIDDKQLNYCLNTALGTATFLNSNLEHPLPLFNERFDVVVSEEVIEHLRHRRQHLKECHRVLKQDGTFIISTPVRGERKSRPERGHCYEYTVDGLMKELIKQGFIVHDWHGISCEGAPPWIGRSIPTFFPEEMVKLISNLNCYKKPRYVVFRCKKP